MSLTAVQTLADYKPVHHTPHAESPLTWRIAWHDGFGGMHTLETHNPSLVVSALRRRQVDWVEIFGATNQPLTRRSQRSL